VFGPVPAGPGAGKQPAPSATFRVVPTAVPNRPGPSLGRYQLLGKLAAGGMAEVFLAEVVGPAGFKKTVVLKRIHEHLSSDPQFVEMFAHEARLAALLAHPNIVQVIELGESDGTFFIAMEHVDGANLRTLADRALELQAPIPYPEAARIVALACEGLGFAHDFAQDGRPLDLVHRDISPDNIMVSRAGAVKVMDFGVAKASTQRHRTKTGTIKGKLAYMPPEQLNAEPLDRRTDLFALGITLYELLAGLSPFDDSSEVAVLTSILHHPPIPLRERRPDCPEPLVAIVERALQKQREDRYPDCRAMQQDLEQYLRGQAPVGALELSKLVQALAPAQPSLAPATRVVTTAPDRGAPGSGASSKAVLALVAGLALAGAVAAVVAAQVLSRESAPEPPASASPGQGAAPALVPPPQPAPVPVVLADPADAGAAQVPHAATRPPKRSLPKMVEIPIPPEPSSHEATTPPSAKGGTPAEHFTAADTSGDDRLDPEEFKALTNVEASFESLDRNRDGYLSREELVRGILGNRKRR